MSVRFPMAAIRPWRTRIAPSCSIPRSEREPPRRGLLPRKVRICEAPVISRLGVKALFTPVGSGVPVLRANGHALINGYEHVSHERFNTCGGSVFRGPGFAGGDDTVV